MEEKRLLADVPADLHKRVKVRAVQDGWGISALIRRLLTLWLQGKVDPGKPPGVKS